MIIPVAILDDERLIRDGEEAVDLYNKDMHNARSRIMPMARGLCAAKRKYSATQDFGDWLQTSSYREIEKNDRAALIKIGEYEDFATKFVRTTHLTSPESIWGAIKELISTSELRKSAPNSSSSSETSQSTPPEPENPRLASGETTVSTAISIERSPFLALKNVRLSRDDIALVHQYMLEPKARQEFAKLLQKKDNRPIWTLLVESIRSGIYGTPSNAMAIGKMRMLFPWLSRNDEFGRQTIMDSYSQKFVRQYVMPLIQSDPSLKQSDGRELNRRSKGKRAAEENAERERATIEQRETAIAKMPSNQQPIIAYGKPLWPPMEGLAAPYSYDELRHAVWYWEYFRGFIGQLKWRAIDESITACHLTKYIRPLQPGFVLAVQHISSAYSEQPEAECSFPIIPMNYFE